MDGVSTGFIHSRLPGHRNLCLTGELVDGWKGTSFMPEHAPVTFIGLMKAENFGKFLVKISEE